MWWTITSHCSGIESLRKIIYFYTSFVTVCIMGTFTVCWLYHIAGRHLMYKCKYKINISMFSLQADSWDSWVWEYRQAPDEIDALGLQMKTIGLHFRVHNSHFSIDRGISPKIEIKCTSIVGNSVRHKSIYPTLSKSVTTNKLAQERLYNSAGRYFNLSYQKYT